MNKRQLDVLSSLFLLILVVIVGVGALMWYNTTKDIDDIHARSREIVIGTDEKLKNTVQELENDLKARMEYEFDVNVDPLDMTRVIKSPKLLAKMGLGDRDRGSTEMRLAATIVSESGESAIVIRYMGSSHVLRVGDKIGGYTVDSIGTRQAVLSRGGYTRTLYNKKATEDYIEDNESVDLSVPYTYSESGK
ncbi:hypothetical protein GF324_02840 [bacterium]|nr:hypothetical protein [bacterium]